MFRLGQKEQSVKEKVLQEIMDLMDAHEGAELGKRKKPAAVAIEVAKVEPAENEEDEEESELEEGAEVESEHTDDPVAQKQIASDHLAEDPKYYTKLKAMESNAEPSEDDKARIAELYHKYCK